MYSSSVHTFANPPFVGDPLSPSMADNTNGVPVLPSD